MKIGRIYTKKGSECKAELLEVLQEYAPFHETSFRTFVLVKFHCIHKKGGRAIIDAEDFNFLYRLNEDLQKIS